MPDRLLPARTSQSWRVAGRRVARLGTWSVAVAVFTATAVSPVPAADHFVPLEPGQVRVGGEIGRCIDRTIENNLLVLDVDGDFLKPLRERNRQSGYVALGKLIDSLVHMAAYARDERVVARKEHVVAETIRTQEPDGYIGLLVPAARIANLWDVHEISYLVLGLTADHHFFHKPESLAAARKLADYLIANWPTDPAKLPGKGLLTVHMASTGIGSAMWALAEETGDGGYLDFCAEQLKIPAWNYPIVRGRWGPIGGHAYTYFARCLAQLRIFRSRPEPALLIPSHKVLDFLTREDGLVITGSCGDHECWHDTQAGTHNLAETCATAYLVRWLDNLLRLEGDPRLGDVMERTITNALLAAQSPDGRRIRYYTPFDGPREYWRADAYCCPGNFRRIVAELPTMIYYRAGAGAGVMVNLYTASTATFELAGGVPLELQQETDYPSSGKVVLHVKPARPTTFPLQLRVPRWCAEASIAVNGEPAGTAKPGFFTLARQWQAGDRVELRMPMPWRLVKGRKAQAGRVAVMRGPTVFCLSRARHKELANVDLRLITLDPASVASLEPPANVRPGGQAVQVKAWGPGAWYPLAKTTLTLTLTEFSDPDGEAIYFNVPNPNASELVDDELAVGELIKGERGASAP